MRASQHTADSKNNGKKNVDKNTQKREIKYTKVIKVINIQGERNWHENWIYNSGCIKQTSTNIMARVTTTTVTQTANELLGTKEKTLYYLIIKTAKGQLVINVGEKTHQEVKALTKEENDTEDKALQDARARAAAQKEAENKKGIK